MYMFHATSGRHLMSQHISPRTTIFYIWHHITPQSASHHRFTPPHLKAQHIRHRVATVHIAPFRIHNDCTPHPHSTSQYISHHITCHHIWHQSQHVASFSTSDISTVAQHIAYATFFITISHRIIYATFQDTPFHTTPYSTLHFLPHFSHIPHHTTFHIEP